MIALPWVYAGISPILGAVQVSVGRSELCYNYLNIRNTARDYHLLSLRLQ